MTKLTVLSIDELADLLQSAANLAVEKYINNISDYPEWITKTQVKKILKYKSATSIDNQVRKGTIDRKYNDNNKPLYNLEDVMTLRDCKLLNY